jgi:predicted site-specific integrase-resolvase
MKSEEVLKILGITRPTLTSYIKTGKIIGNKLPNGYYDYNEESVYKFLGKPLPSFNRVNIIYARVSTYKQKQDLTNQVYQLIEYCNINNIKYDKVFQEIASGIDFDRKDFSELVNLVINKKINNIYITYKDRISRLSFITLENMFKQFGTNIIVINDTNNSNEENDLFEELINIIHLFSTKIYSKRHHKILNNIKTNLTTNNI